MMKYIKHSQLNWFILNTLKLTGERESITYTL